MTLIIGNRTGIHTQANRALVMNSIRKLAAYEA